MEPRVEADDIISYVAQHSEFADWQKVIVSSDKDFYQVLDDNTILFRPTQSQVLNKRKIVEQFGIHPLNFALARAMVGDKSDNIEGLKGVGLKTVKKRFPFLVEEKERYTSDIEQYSLANMEDGVLFYSKVVDNIEKIEHNYKMMQLYSPIMSVQLKMKVDQVLGNYIPEFNKTELKTLMIKDGIGEVNLGDLYTNFNKTIHDRDIS